MKILPLLLIGGLASLVILVGLTLLWDTDPTRWPHRWAILDAFDGQVDPTAGGKYQFECFATAWALHLSLPLSAGPARAAGPRVLAGIQDTTGVALPSARSASVSSQ